ncbi:hypothetical protein C7B69_14105 [filamentous cyanobacterium Phorm 46]|nr:hypothetical protein C7B69_14105 [filamentous cyanobacterium Phorm 46]PSB52247.1 hypothetical protein C7B67_07745 [filamentous cyanobacterium Phorm 6]
MKFWWSRHSGAQKSNLKAEQLNRKRFRKLDRPVRAKKIKKSVQLPWLKSRRRENNVLKAHIQHTIDER